MFLEMAVDDANLSRWQGEETEFALDPLARLFTNDSHRRTCRGCAPFLRLDPALTCRDVVVRFITFRGRTPGVANSPLNISLPASVTRLLAAVFMFCPDMTSPAMRTPVFNARFPKAMAPRLMSGIAIRIRPLNRLPSPCPRWTRAPTK